MKNATRINMTDPRVSPSRVEPSSWRNAIAPSTPIRWPVSVIYIFRHGPAVDRGG